MTDAATPATPATPVRPRRSHRRRWIVGAIVVVVVAWGAVLALQALQAYRDARRGLAALELVRSNLSPSNLVSSAPERSLTTAASSFRAAHAAISSPLFVPAEYLPVLGRQLRSVQDLSQSAAVVSETGSSFLRSARQVLDAPHGSGSERLADLRRLAALASAAYHRLAGLDTGPSDALVAPLAAKRAEFVDQLDQAKSHLLHAAQVSATVARILQGPATYLVLAANNAEMRAGSGAFLDVGTATTSDGSVHLSAMEPSGNLGLPPGAVHVTGGLERNWGWLEPGTDWRNLGVTPQFPVTAALAAKMWLAKTGQHVDGVLALDVAGLQQLLSVTGPVAGPGGTVIDAGNAVTYLLHDEYAGLTDNATQDASREDGLGALATEVLHALEGQSLGLKALATAMAQVTAGRHLLVWSASPAAETAWKDSGVAGSLAADNIDAAVINRGGNKLDQYLSVGVSLRARPAPGPAAATEVTMTVHLHNATPPGQSQFIAGPYPGLAATYGEYVGILAVNLPGYASKLGIVGNPPLTAEGGEGPTWLLAEEVTVPDGASTDVVIHFQLPGRRGVMTVLPSARIPPEQWTGFGQTFSDQAPTTLTW